MRRLHRMVSARDRRISKSLFCLVLLGLCLGAQSQVKDVKSRHDNLRLAYESVEEGNDHEAAIASVEAGLGGEGESADQLRTLEQDSSALLHSLRDVFPKPEELKPVREPSIAVVATSSDLLSDLKSAALARLEKKIEKELLKETAKLGPTANNMVGPTAESDKLPPPKAAARIYRTVREKLSALPWSYSGSTGPENWGGLGYSVCSSGSMQSPIDIKTLSSATRAIDILNIAVLDWQFDQYFVTSYADGSADHALAAHGTASLSAGPPKLFLDLPVNSRFSDPAGGGGGGRRRLLHNYPPKPTESFDGHAFTVQALGTPTLFVDGAKYALREMRTHTPSEHTVDGARFDMELQLVHTLDGAAAAGAGAARQVVVAVLFSAAAGAAGAEPPFLRELAATIGMEHFGASPRWLARDFSFKEVAGALRGSARMTSYYKYRGSLTQPPCTEGVTWFVVKHPLAVGAATLGAFSALQGRNNRPTQPAHDRLVEFTP